MSSVTIQNVTKSFGNTVVLENFDAVFQNGEFITLLGPSGCGKTTMLRIIAGFEKPTSGCVKFDDRVVSSDKLFIPPEKRDIGMVFQSYAVWPHMTVFDNVAYPLRIKKMDKDAIQKKYKAAVDELFNTLRGSERDRSMGRFREKVSSFKASGDRRLRSERERLYNKVRQLEQEIGLLENNIGFFAKSKNAEALVADVRAKIERAREEMASTIEKVKLIDKQDQDENNNA